MRDWERAWGPREQHRICSKSTGSWEETRTLAKTQGRWAGASEGLGSAFPASDGVIVQVPANVPQEDEQDSEEEWSQEDGLGHWGQQGLHVPAKGMPQGPEGGTAMRAVQAATCTRGEMP